MTFAERLTALMDERQISASRLAVKMEDEGLGVTGHAVYNWMTGRVQPRFDYIPIIAKALDVDPNTLCGWESEEAEPAATGTKG